MPQAFEMLEEMEAQGHEFGEGYRRPGRDGLVGVLEAGMRGRIDQHLEALARRGEADRRNGSYPRWLLSELGWIELSVPRRRRSHAGPWCSAGAGGCSGRHAREGALERFRIERNRSRFFSLTAADPRVRACAGAPEDRRAAVAA